MITEEERAAIAAAIPTGVVVPDNFWRDLEMVIDICRGIEERRTARPPAAERERWQRIQKSADVL
jgi:hypothetical protein